MSPRAEGPFQIERPKPKFLSGNMMIGIFAVAVLVLTIYTMRVVFQYQAAADEQSAATPAK